MIRGRCGIKFQPHLNTMLTFSKLPEIPQMGKNTKFNVHTHQNITENKASNVYILLARVVGIFKIKCAQ